jgi:hypothetical protein
MKFVLPVAGGLDGETIVRLDDVMALLRHRADACEQRGDDPSVDNEVGIAWHVRAGELRETADVLASWLLPWNDNPPDRPALKAVT